MNYLSTKAKLEMQNEKSLVADKLLADKIN